MIVRILEEHGFDAALLGMSLSYFRGDEPIEQWWNDEKRQRAIRVARKLAPQDGGHNKFLESIQVWLLVQASRGFWQQFDTYRVGVTKQSQSTMHTLAKRRPEFEDFSSETPPKAIEAFQNLWDRQRGDINGLKAALPEGYLQWRVVCTNYKALRHIAGQRETHRLGEWPAFIDELRPQLQHAELLGI